MAKILIDRLIQSAIVLLFVSLASFAIFSFIGDPVSVLLGQDSTSNERAKVRDEMGLNDPIIVQYGRFVVHGLHGDFGTSYRLREPVGPLIISKLSASLELVGFSALIALVVGITIGCFSAVKPQSAASRLLLAASLFGVSVPPFVVGIAFIYLFSVTLHWLPSSGRATVEIPHLWSTSFLSVAGWKSVILPAATLALFQLSLIVRLVRTEMRDALRTDFVRFARARGLPARTIYFNHALRNSLVPIINIAAINIGGLIAYSVVTETVFQWPGCGFLFIQSIEFADIPVLSAYLCLVALAFLAINLIADFLMIIADPRLRTGSEL